MMMMMMMMTIIVNKIYNFAIYNWTIKTLIVGLYIAMFCILLID